MFRNVKRFQKLFKFLVDQFSADMKHFHARFLDLTPKSISTVETWLLKIIQDFENN